MVDAFPFPRITEETSEKQIKQLVDYLIQFKETLEFALTNISTENLSPELISKLNELGADIQKSNDARAEELAQLTVDTLTISDVCNSNTFKDAVKSEVKKHNVTINVNTETGHLEYYTVEQGG